MIEKRKIMLEIEEIERALMDLSQWNESEKKLAKFTEKITGPVTTIEQKERMIKLLKGYIISARNEKVKLDNDKMYLTEIIEKERPKFGNNNLILAPVGSGKTSLIKHLINHESVLLLVSTTSLKDKLVPKDEKERKELGNRMYSTKYKEVYGKDNYKILVMTYFEFGNKIRRLDDFALQFTQIFCDEIHSLPHYEKISESIPLSVALKYLVSTHEGQEKFHFTATDEHLKTLEEETKGILKNIKIFNYLVHPNIKRYMPLSSYAISGIEQIRSHLKARKESFKYFDYKAFAFSRSIESLNRLGEISKEEGFNPLILWSINNEENVMTEEQIKKRNYVLSTGLIPDEYDILIVNSAMQEGWDLIDPRVKLAIMNTKNETELIQATGRIRQDIDILVYRLTSGKPDYIINIPTEMLDIELDSKRKEELIDRLDIYDEKNKKLKWQSVKKILQEQGFIINDKTIRENGKQKRVSLISIDK